MSFSELEKVLNILKKLKNSKRLGMNNSCLDHVRFWISESGNADITDVLKFCSEINWTISQASSYIETKDLEPEAVTGLNSVLISITQAFSVPGINNSVSSYFPQIDMAIASFSMLVSILRIQEEKYIRKNPEDLIVELDEIIILVENAEIDNTLKTQIIKQLKLIQSLLRNVDIVGVEGAMSSYADLVIRVLSKVDVSNSPEEEKNLLKKIENWGKKLRSFADWAESGRKLLEAGEKIAGFLG